MDMETRKRRSSAGAAGADGAAGAAGAEGAAGRLRLALRLALRPKVPKQTENEVEAECIGWLRKQGWIVRRQHSGVFYTRDGRPLKVGETGECDWRAFKGGDARGILHQQYFELELKATGKKPSKAQRNYMTKRMHQGVLAFWADSLDSMQRQLSYHGVWW